MKGAGWLYHLVHLFLFHSKWYAISSTSSLFLWKAIKCTDYKINQIDTISMFEYVEYGQFYLVFCLFCLLFVCCAHSIRGKYLIKIQYRLQNDRFVCMCVCAGLPVLVIKSRLRVDCLRPSMEFKVLVFFINWRCHLTIYEHCDRSIDWYPINVMPYIWATSMLGNG